MSDLKLLSKILRLKDMKIIHFRFKNRHQELHLTVKRLTVWYHLAESLGGWVLEMAAPIQQLLHQVKKTR